MPIYPLQQGCIFREDFKSPELAARNGLVSIGNPGPTWVSNGVRFGVTNSFVGKRIAIQSSGTFISESQLLPWTGLYKTLFHVARIGGGGITACEVGWSNVSNRIYVFLFLDYNF